MISWKYLAIVLFVVGVGLLLASCGAEDDQILGPADTNSSEETNSWLWAFDAHQDSLRVYHGSTGCLYATFYAQPHGTMHEILAGPAENPSVWMGSNGQGYAFSAGFETHGDHAHMEIPVSLGTVITGQGNAHLTKDPAGQTVSWANDSDEDFTLVDVESLEPVTVGHGSPHSGSLLANNLILATHMNEKWARFINIQSGEIEATVSIDTLAHGEAYYEQNEQAFIPCLNGVSVVDFAGQDILTHLAYPSSGRVNFLFHGSGQQMALAPVKLEEGNASEIWLLSMDERSWQVLELPGAQLAWNRAGGNLCLSGDGSRAVFTDLFAQRAYVVELDSGEVTTLTVEKADLAAALSEDGSFLWLMDKDNGDIHFWHFEEESWHEDTGFEVNAHSDWIFVTSLDPSVSILSEYPEASCE
ncbi:MAG: hypothetical protein GY780_19160 [bacterium]|nr:hypothetical protein [bacterium]